MSVLLRVSEMTTEAVEKPAEQTPTQESEKMEEMKQEQQQQQVKVGTCSPLVHASCLVLVAAVESALPAKFSTFIEVILNSVSLLRQEYHQTQLKFGFKGFECSGHSCMIMPRTGSDSGVLWVMANSALHRK